MGRRKQTGLGKSFSKELLDYLENTKERKQKNQNEERPIIDQIISNNNLTTGNKNSIITCIPIGENGLKTYKKNGDIIWKKTDKNE